MIGKKTYSDEVLTHFYEPKHIGHFCEDAADVSTGTAGSAASGDVVRLQIRVKDGIVIDACFKAQGTCATIAVASWVANWVIEKSLQQCEALNCAEILQALELTPLRKHSALLVLDALQSAVKLAN